MKLKSWRRTVTSGDSNLLRLVVIDVLDPRYSTVPRVPYSRCHRAASIISAWRVRGSKRTEHRVLDGQRQPVGFLAWNFLHVLIKHTCGHPYLLSLQPLLSCK